MGIYNLSGIEKLILFKKYTKNGSSPEEANRKVNDFCNSLVKRREEFKKKKLTDEEIDQIFKEEFSKLRESLQ
jgi:hypothetical protein